MGFQKKVGRLWFQRVLSDTNTRTVIPSTSRAEQEFRIWAASLTPSDLSDHEKKLLNLLLENFAALASLGTAGGLRAKKICELLDQQRGKLNSAYEGI